MMLFGNKKKLSVIIPHFNRKRILYHTLRSFALSESINKCEFIIVDDCSNEENSLTNIKSDFPNLTIKFVQIDKQDKDWNLPTFPLNLAEKMASSKRILIINPESFPLGDILTDVIYSLKRNTYLVYGCYSVNKKITEKILSTEVNNFTVKQIREELPLFSHTNLVKDGENAWYQHSYYRPLKYNFCTAICKKDIRKIGGTLINDIYSDGLGYGDDDLVYRLEKNNFDIIQNDFPFVLHLNHYEEENNYMQLDVTKKNRDIFLEIQRGINIISNKYKDLYKKYTK